MHPQTDGLAIIGPIGFHRRNERTLQPLVAADPGEDQPRRSSGMVASKRELAGSDRDSIAYLAHGDREHSFARLLKTLHHGRGSVWLVQRNEPRRCAHASRHDERNRYAKIGTEPFACYYRGVET